MASSSTSSRTSGSATALPSKRWQDIWLNEGFAIYAEWLWSEQDGIATAQESFDAWYNGIEADSPFWQLTIGDPGPDHLFDGAVYIRGAMALHQLRLAVGDRDFFRILRTWTRRYEGGNVATWQFIRLAEQVSGQQLDESLHHLADDAGATGARCCGRPQVRLQLDRGSGPAQADRSGRRDQPTLNAGHRPRTGRRWPTFDTRKGPRAANLGATDQGLLRGSSAATATAATKAPKEPTSRATCRPSMNAVAGLSRLPDHQPAQPLRTTPWPCPPAPSDSPAG